MERAAGARGGRQRRRVRAARRAAALRVAAATAAMAGALMVGAPGCATSGKANAGGEVPPPPRTDYAFSLSASAADPGVHTAARAATPHAVHLWLTCGPEGAAACEGRVRSGLAVQRFTPEPGILDIGNGATFRMAIPNCPRDTTILLGHWDVWDTGGTVCLEDPPDGALAVVDCAPTGVLSTSVSVVGYSSTGAPPCSTFPAPADTTPEP